MEHILLVQTGGTIQSSLQSNIIDIKKNQTDVKNHALIAAYESTHDTNVSWEVAQPLEILSENLTLAHWNTLVSFFGKLDFSYYDGIILSHGSDTLAYTSSMLGLLLGHIHIPLVLIASNYVLEDKRSNGLANFSGAVDFICTHSYHGVYTIYQDEKGNLPVYLATHLLPADCYRDSFSDFTGMPVGFIKEHHFVLSKPNDDLCSSLKSSCATNPSKHIAKEVFSDLAERTKAFTKEILCIQPYPGFSYSYLYSALENQRIAAILHGLYHSGTLCNASDQDYNFQQFYHHCEKHHLPVYLCSVKENQKNQYASIADVSSHTKAIPLCNISYVSAYCKLLIAYNQNVYPPEEYMMN